MGKYPMRAVFRALAVLAPGIQRWAVTGSTLNSGRVCPIDAGASYPGRRAAAVRLSWVFVSGNALLGGAHKA